MKKITLIAAIAFSGALFAQTNSCYTSATYDIGYGNDSYNRQIVTADFNGDGKKDLATVDYNDNTVSVLLGDGTGKFADNPYITFATGSCPKGLVAADFNADGNADIAVTNNCDNTISVSLGNGAGGFGVPATFAVGSEPRGIISGDFNADGKIDLAVTNFDDDEISVLIGNGNGTFATQVTYSVGNGPRNIISADFNGDGKADLASSLNYDDEVSILLGNGDGTFGSENTFSCGGSPQVLAAADFNGDGNLDIVVTSWNDGDVDYLQGNGDGTFASYTGLGTGNSPMSVTVADFNSDGNLDFASVSRNYDEMSVLVGDGNGNFSTASSFNVNNPLAIVSGDFNADGKMDIAVADRYSEATVFLNVPLPSVSASASATSVCPGTSVVLTGTGAGLLKTVTYNITSGDLSNVYSSCNSSRVSWSSQFGFYWNDTLPSGAKIQSVSIKLNNDYNDYASGHNGYLNYTYVGTPSNPYISDYCNSPSNTNNIITYGSAASNYYTGNQNYFYLNTYGWDYSLSPNPTWPAGVYAQVTVTYGADYSWSGPYGVGQGVSFVPGATANYVVTGTNEVGCANTASITVTVNPATSITMTPVDVTCDPALCNGTMTAAPTGGTAPYTYAWSTGGTSNVIGSLCAGSYTVTTTDANGCTATNNASIINTSTITLTSNSTDANCLCSGTADATFTGGTAPYTYAWSNGASTSAITGLCPGSYTFTGTDANGCKAYLVETISNDPDYTLSAVKTNAACTGSVSCSGTATVTPVAANAPLDPPYTFVWAPAGGASAGATAIATGLCAGTYTLTATDNSGCTRQTTVVIGVTPPTLTFTNITANCGSACNGKSTVSISGGSAPYTFAWSNGATTSTATGLCAGTTHTVTVTDASGCSKSGVTTIGTAAGVVINSLTSTNVSCDAVCNGTAMSSVSGGTAPYTYAWSNGATTATATGLCVSTGSTSYTLTVTDAGGCTAVRTVTVGNNNNEPNVSDWSWNDASCDAVCNGSIQAYGYNGSGTYSYVWSNGQSVATATGLCAGTSYTVTVTDAAGCTNTNDWTMDSDPMDVYISTNDAACLTSCNGDADLSLSFNATNGPATYLWSNGSTTTTATGLCAGTVLTVTVTSAEGCVATDNENILASNNLYVDIHASGWGGRRATCKQSCDGVNASDYLSGNVGPVTYLWNTGATTKNASNVCAYMNLALTVTDSVGCSYTETEQAMGDYDDGVKIDYTNNTDVLCNGICNATADVVLDSYDYAPISYMWSNGGTNFLTTGLCAGTYTITVVDTLGCRDSSTVTINSNSSINFSTSSTDATCQNVCNGTASATGVVNGVPPYKYTWMPGGQTTATATGLCEGVTYSVTVKDANGCTTMKTRYVDYDANVLVSVTKKDASCAGVCNGLDSVSSVSNANGPLMYQWMPSGGTSKVATGLCAGTYSVMVTDSVGCTATATNAIGTGTAPSINVNTTPTFCSAVCNGTAVASVTIGGTSPFSYSWSNGKTTAAVTGLCAGGYAVTVTDVNGCFVNGFANVAASAGTMTVTTTSTAASCNGICDGVATAMTNGGTAPYAYAWSPSGGSLAIADSLCGGVYTVVATDVNGCTQSAAVTVTKPATLATNVTVTNSTSCVEGNGTATANTVGGTAPYMFTWTPTGQLTQTAVTLPNGTYSVVVTDASGCTATSSGVVTCTSGINDMSLENSISVYPNPAIGNVTVEVSSGSIQMIEIDNVLGQTVNTVTNPSHKVSNKIDVSGQADGIYMIRVTTEAGTVTKKLTIQK